MRSPDVVIVGGGVVGLAIAVEAGRRGLTVDLFDAGRTGAASRAAAGLIAPTLGTAPPGVTALFLAAAREYPDFLDWLAEIGAPRVPIGWGVLEVAASADRLHALQAGNPEARVLNARSLREIEPALTTAAGAVMHAADAWLDPGSLVDALASATERMDCVRRSSAAIRAIDVLPQEIALRTEDGTVQHAPLVVVAAGAWSAHIGGLPTALPVTPARGQLVLIQGPHQLTRAVAFDDGYIVPRGDGVIVGSTMEHVGFDPTTTPAALRGLEESARAVIPGTVAAARSRRGWAGLRPVTPDMLPIIDRDPRSQRLIYACGHSKNGVLLAPSTARAVVALLTGERPTIDMAPFSVGRFS
ncbi:MAG TPA: FAD-dependent oxidoreductase [Gemmatimonadaceae bacterium]|nr:FAD-dependent oxidoreductase [Gemmatimonadaceae bacterium]